VAVETIYAVGCVDLGAEKEGRALVEHGDGV